MLLSISLFVFCFFFFNDTATTEIYTLSLHDALPISVRLRDRGSLAMGRDRGGGAPRWSERRGRTRPAERSRYGWRSEEHTSELQSRAHLVCRLLLEKKKKKKQVTNKQLTE